MLTKPLGTQVAVAVHQWLDIVSAHGRGLSVLTPRRVGGGGGCWDREKMAGQEQGTVDRGSPLTRHHKPASQWQLALTVLSWWFFFFYLGLLFFCFWGLHMVMLSSHS